MNCKYLINSPSERLLFKAVSDIYFDEWLPFFENPLSFQHWDADLKTPIEECKNWFKYQEYRNENNLGGMNALIEKETNKLVGFCGLLIQNIDNKQELEIGYSILPKFWGRGFASEAAQHCKKIAFEKKWSDSLISIISFPNIPSQTVAIRNNMIIDKKTVYNKNKVYVFRVNIKD